MSGFYFEEDNMLTKQEVLDFYRYLANYGLGIDHEGAYSYQCVHDPVYIAYHSLAGEVTLLFDYSYF